MDQAAMRAYVKVVETNGFSSGAAVADGSILGNPSGECFEYA